MIAAVYLRKSTVQAGIADSEKSVARQLDQARAFAAAKGWTIDESAIFTDDGISGAEDIRRPGFVALLAAVERGPSFQVLLNRGSHAAVARQSEARELRIND